MKRFHLILGGCAALLVAACQSREYNPDLNKRAPGDTQPLTPASPPTPPTPPTLPPPPVDTSGYQLPANDVVKIVDADPTPGVRVGPRGARLMLSTRESYPSIGLVAEPFLRLAGMRIHPDHNARRQIRYGTGLSFQTLADGREVTATLPMGARISTTTWSPDGARVALTLATPSGLEPWIVDVATGEAKRLTDRRANNVLGSPLRWMPGSKQLLVRLIPQGHGPPPRQPPVPRGPVIQAASGGKKAQNRTYQDLLQSPHDETLFTHYGTSVLALVDATSGAVTTLGEPGLFLGADPAPDGIHLLVKAVHKPFSYQVPFYRFPHTIEIWDTSGHKTHTLADLPLADAVPIQGVPTGPRVPQWQPHHPATLQWVEALDEGDPNRKVPHRDKILRQAAPFAGQPTEVTKIQHRYSSAAFTTRKDEMLVTEYDRDRRWITTTLHASQAEPRVLFDRSRRDRYGDPGRPIRTTLEDGMRVVLVEDGSIYLTGAGATPEGDRPFLDRMKLPGSGSGSGQDPEKIRVFSATAEAYASFVDFAGTGSDRSLVIRRESPQDPPNFFLRRGDEERALTGFPDPHPQFTGVEKKLLTYKRRDGVPLSGTLYLPPGYDGQSRLPLFVWAYPVEYNDKRTAGQVRAQPNRFTRLSGTSPLMMLTQGYAVLDGAAMPVVGDPKTMNDKLLPQLVDAAKAAIDAVVAEGVADRDRVAVGGHSYGAFMTANLLAHCDLFKAGIARSGAYNRSLTPFGFQSERRTLWEAPRAYVNVSPMFAAHKINEPLLMIHGEADNNAGTFPLQSRRLFHALKGLGGTAKLVILPHESHGYRARESVLHVLAESFAWLDTHVKNAKSVVSAKRPEPKSKTAVAAGGQ